MKVPGRVLIGVAAWLVVVLLGSMLVWGVISRAGEEVVSGEPDTPQSTPSSSPTSASPTPSPTKSGSPEPEPVRRTWSAAPGVVVVECTGNAAALVNALAHSGWRTEVDDFGPRRVEVEFEPTGEGEDTKIRAECAGGAPVFEVDAD